MAEFRETPIVDVRKLVPGDQILFSISVSPTYLVEIQPENKVVMWMNRSPEGLAATTDDLVTLITEGKAKRERQTTLYPAALIKDGYNRRRTRTILPYYAYVNPGELQDPDTIWGDVITSIRVKRTGNR